MESVEAPRQAAPMKLNLGQEVTPALLGDQLTGLMAKQHEQVLERLQLHETLLREALSPRGLRLGSLKSPNGTSEVINKQSSVKSAIFKTFDQCELEKQEGAADVQRRKIKESFEYQEVVLSEAKVPPCAERIVNHAAFDAFFALVVLTNSFFIGIDIEMSLANGGERPTSIRVVQHLYTLLFSVELAMRLCARGWKLFTGDDCFWAWLDLFIVTTSIWEVLVDLIHLVVPDSDVGGLVGMSTLKAFRIVRITRIVKAVRMIRVFRFVIAFRTLITSIVHTFKSLAWALMLLLLIVYVFAVLFTQAVNDHLRHHTLSDPDLQAAERFFSSLPETMLSLFMCVANGVSWVEVIRPLKAVSTVWVFLFIFYISFTYFAVLNVVTGVFCQAAMEGAKSDHQTVMHAILADKQKHLAKIRALFNEIGKHQDGYITYAMLEEKVNSPEVRDYFGSLGLDIWDAWSFFKLLDLDEGGSVEIEEFLMGCLRLRGSATAMDVQKIINAPGLERVADGLSNSSGWAHCVSHG
ncbi:unnamed protein product [Effrenium voratum]|nr:unnamed protein product [Effrenium voratum]